MTDAGSPTTGVVTFLFTDIEGSTRLELALGTDALRDGQGAPSRAAARRVRGERRHRAEHPGRLLFRVVRERPVGNPCRHRGAARARPRAVAGRHRGPRPDGHACRRGDGHGRRRRRLRRQSRGAHRGRGQWRPDRHLGHGASTGRRRFRWRIRAARPRASTASRTCSPPSGSPRWWPSICSRSSRRSIRSTPGRTICRPS